MVLASELNEGYHKFEDCRLRKVNDIEIKSVKHLAKVVDECPQDFLKLEVARFTIIYIDNTETAKQLNQEMLIQHNIPRDRSPDLLSENQTNHINQTDTIEP